MNDSDADYNARHYSTSSINSYGGISIMSELRTNRIVPRDGLASGIVVVLFKLNNYKTLKLIQLHHSSGDFGAVDIMTVNHTNKK